MFEREEIKEKVDAFLARKGYVLFDVKWSKAQKGGNLRVFADKEEGGISIRECLRLNNEISLLLGEEMDIMCPYMLEVSSPGMDWPLKTTREWKRVLNQRIEVLLVENKKIEGMLSEIQEDGIVVDLSEGSKKVFFKDIVKAKQKII